jgi:trimeric autotransporter adhesin
MGPAAHTEQHPWRILVNHCKFNTRSATLLLVLSAPLISQAQTPVIENATVNLAKSYISLAGSNFSPTSIAPTVTVGGTSRTVYSFTNTAMVVEVPSTLAAATFLVTVTNSVPHSGSAYVTVGAVGPAGATGPAGPQGPAGTITLPFNGSGAGVGNAVLNITNSSPAHSAVAGHGAQALAGSDTGGSGVGAYGGASNGTDAVTGYGGTGVYTVGGTGTAPSDVGGIGLNGYGGDAPGQLAFGGAGVRATGGNAGGEFGGGGDGIDATGGTGGFSGGDGIYAVAGVSNTSSLSPYAGVFNGDVDIEGALSKSSGSFKIDHPLDPANKYLYHSFVESPDMLNIYNGNVTTDSSGTAIVTMPAWFEALNTDFRYQLTVIGQFAQAIVASEITNGSFTIKTSKPGVKVSWQVTGVRQDAWANAHRIQVEVDKAPQDQGHYIHPELFGHEGEPSIAEIHHPRPPAAAPRQ